MSGVVKPDLLMTEAFILGLPASFAENFAAIPESGRPVFRTFARTDLTSALLWLSPFQGKANCYYHANPLRKDFRNRKAKRSDVEVARLLQVDIDDLKALEVIERFPLRPSVTVMSGGGYQCLWFLDEPSSDLTRVEAINRQIAARLGGDSCFSADHLLRLPGTLNVPNAKKRRAGRTTTLAQLVPSLTDFARQYSLEEVERTLGTRQLPAVASGSIDAAVSPVATSQLSSSVLPETVALITAGDDVDRPIGQPGSSYKSRSEVVFRVALDLTRAGEDEATIAGVLINPANGVSASVLEKSKPLLYAQRQAQRALRIVQEGWPNTGKDGRPVASLANALAALTRLGLTFEYNEFQNRKRVNGHVLQELTGELSDDLCAAIRNEVLRRWKVDLGKEHVRDAALTLCLENRVHPIRDYLASLKWDGTPRLGTWMTHYLGAEDNPLNAAIGSLVLVAAVRRVRRPGVKFDAIPVLEGPQGSGKSTAILILAGEENFSDQEILTLDTKAQMEAVEGVWIYELGELQGLSRTETDRVKAFASRRVDRGRPAYARFREDRPRQTIFIGTTNDEQYLRDPTGNRRFWPVRTGKIDLAALDRDRDQLLAEAAFIEASGASLTLDESLWATAADVQESRLLDDPWLDALAGLTGTIEGGVERVTTTEVLAALAMPAERQNQTHAKRLAPLMRKRGWTGPKSIRIRGAVVRGYERDVGDAEDSPDSRTMF